jgi:hypothetical protein
VNVEPKNDNGRSEQSGRRGFDASWSLSGSNR